MDGPHLVALSPGALAQLGRQRRRAGAGAAGQSARGPSARCCAPGSPRRRGWTRRCRWSKCSGASCRRRAPHRCASAPRRRPLPRAARRSRRVRPQSHAAVPAAAIAARRAAAAASAAAARHRRRPRRGRASPRRRLRQRRRARGRGRRPVSSSRRPPSRPPTARASVASALGGEVTRAGSYSASAPGRSQPGEKPKPRSPRCGPRVIATRESRRSG